MRLLLIALILLVSCGTKPQEKRYTMRGEIVRLEPATKTAIIKHEKIGDWMEAMTMDYPVPNDQDWKKLAPGERIEATVIVTPSSYRVVDIKVAGK